MKNTTSATITLLACVTAAVYGQQKVDPAVFVQSLKQVSAPGDGVMFGVNAKDEIFAWVGKEWVNVEGQLKQISAGSKDHIWGVNALNKVYQMTPSGWLERPGPMKQVAVAKGGGAVAALDLGGYPHYWAGTSWARYPNAPVLSQISIGKASRIYGIGTFGEIYRYRSDKGDWRRIQGRLDKISVGVDGSIAGVNHENEGYIKKDADVEAEVNGSGAPAQWIEGDQNIAALEIMDIKTLLVVDRNGLIVQREVPPEQDVIINADLVVDGSFLEPGGPTLNLGPSKGAATYASNGCVYLSGTLKLDPPQSGQTPVNYDHNLANTETMCLKGTFSVHPTVVPPPNTFGPKYSVPGIVTLLDFRSVQGKTAYDAPYATIGTATASNPSPPPVCEPKHFRNQSHHSFVEFQLPAGFEGRQVQIPGGSYNNYVFPACNRVWWDNLTFSCSAQKGWTLTQGRYDADAHCIASTPSHPFIATGNR